MTAAAARALVGVYGGTFDPVHFGHLRTALELREVAALDHVRFVPCRLPPHRDPPRAPGELRRRMLEAAIGDDPGFVVDGIELARPGPSYTVDTLAALRAALPDADLGLILGMDAFLGLPSWHRWETILELANLLVAHRPGWAPPTDGPLGRLLAQRRVAEPGGLAGQRGRIWLHAVTALDISSSDVRERAGRGSDTRFLLPDGVREIITSSGCYRDRNAAA